MLRWWWRKELLSKSSSRTFQSSRQSRGRSDAHNDPQDSDCQDTFQQTIKTLSAQCLFLFSPMRNAFFLLPLVFLLNVCASPTSFRGFAAPIKHHRRALKPTTSHKLFDVKFFQNELEGLFVKYAKAGTILQSDPPFPVVAPAHVVVEMPLFSMSEGPDAGTLPSPGPRTAKMPLLDMISDSLDLIYYGPLDFGTPPQR
ncbi:hypothetical protein GALMADRAFT_556670 [Galerina marginata CBS 339.88]|uniref:Uncharacterized protein n=1 Tax=Galerina marginata (strain CBS 339.88) TaxID=685588 RepID=A0A067SZG3_GALM3|nr:hypothetical protein GALMADRAFT_556670 [Galerina marginata CBS 339.88]